MVGQLLEVGRERKELGKGKGAREEKESQRLSTRLSSLKA
jgi:hypothetical protein